MVTVCNVTKPKSPVPMVCIEVPALAGDKMVATGMWYKELSNTLPGALL